jgi:hypothetical protein
MPNIVAVSRDRHAGKAWRRPGGYDFASQLAVIPLVGAELAKAALEMPIGFVPAAGGYAPVAVMSPIAGRNFFIGPQGQWLGGYLPAALRAYPFALHRVEGSEEAVLCIDEDSGLVVDRDGTAEAFFDGAGNPSPATKAIFDFLLEIERNRAVTNRAVASLSDAGLIQPWPLSLKVADQITPLNGLFRIDEAGLNALDDVGFLKLRKLGALPLAYMHFLSLGQLTAFDRLNRAQHQLTPQQERQRSLDEIFTLPQSDTLRFN